MALHGGAPDGQALGHLQRRETVAHEPQHLELPGGEVGASVQRRERDLGARRASALRPPASASHRTVDSRRRAEGWCSHAAAIPAPSCERS